MGILDKIKKKSEEADLEDESENEFIPIKEDTIDNSQSETSSSPEEENSTSKEEEEEPQETSIAEEKQAQQNSGKGGISTKITSLISRPGGKEEKESKTGKGEKHEDNSKFSLSSLLERFLNPSCEDMEEIEFDVGPISEPEMGVHVKEVNVTYIVEEPFQYAHVEYNGEEIEYQCIEPPLSAGELRNLEIIESAFEKLTSTDILVVDPKDRKNALRERFRFIIDIYQFNMTDYQNEKMFYYLLKKYTGFGKIDLLMNDPYIEDITCNGPDMNVYINHRMYGSIKSNVIFEELELNNFVMKMAQSSGRHISVLQPIRDATLTDGSRVNLTLGKEVTKKGSTFTIRRFKSNPVSVVDLINYGTFTCEVFAYLWIVVEYKRAILAAGGTASGKTTTLNALGSFIRPEYKIVSIEDTAEMNLMHPNWTQSVTRAGFGSGSDGKSAGDIELYDLLKAALRQRPEYIVVGEVRGAEAGTLFQAISVGHPCMGTIHAGSMKELVSRVESEPMNVPRNLFSSTDVIIFNSMIKVGEHFIRRAVRIVELVEVDPDRGDLITNPVFKWNAHDDTFVFSGSSAMFEDITEEFGMDEEYLMNEMKDRTKQLEWMRENNIKEYEDVVREIRRYARDKDAIMEEIDHDKHGTEDNISEEIDEMTLQEIENIDNMAESIT